MPRFQLVAIGSTGVVLCTCMMLLREGRLCRHVLACIALEVSARTSALSAYSEDRVKQIQHDVAIQLMRNTHPRWLLPGSAFGSMHVALEGGVQGLLYDIVAIAARQAFGVIRQQQNSSVIEAGVEYDTAWEPRQRLTHNAKAARDQDILAVSRQMVQVLQSMPGIEGLDFMKQTLERAQLLKTAGPHSLIDNPLIIDSRTKVAKKRKTSSTSGQKQTADSRQKARAQKAASNI